APYDVVAIKNGAEVWTGSMLTDQVSRLDTATGQVVDYLLPRTTNIRRAFVDSFGERPILWGGSNHGAAIVKVEPLESTGEIEVGSLRAAAHRPHFLQRRGW